MKKLNCIIIDDEPLACKGLSEYIAEVDSLHLLAMVHTPSDAIPYLKDTDLMYLDINMPKISGIEFLQQVKNPPITIITTAYQQYALQGFELDVLDYLLKPISFPRFLKATTKAIDYFKLKENENQNSNVRVQSDYFFVKSNGVLERIVMNDILAIEAMSNYITLHCRDRKIIAYLTLKQILDYLPAEQFLKVHKSYVVALNKIEKIDRDEIIAGAMRIPVGGNFKDDLEQQLIQGKILRRE